MSSLGEHLKQLRLDKGLSIEELSKATKINKRFLAALEEDNLQALPGGVINRGFVRAFVRFCGGDENAFLAEYESALREQQGPEINLLAAQSAAASSASERRKVYFFILVIILVLAAIFMIYYFRYSSRLQGNGGSLHLAEVNQAPQPSAGSAAIQQEPGGQTGSLPPVLPPPPSESATNPGQSTGPTPSSTSPATEPGSVSGSATTGAPQAAHPEGSANPSNTVSEKTLAAPTSGRIKTSAPESDTTNGNYKLKIVAAEKTWLSIKKDGKEVFRRIMLPNEALNLNAKDRFDIVCGNAGGIVVSLDGKTLPPLGGKGEVKTVTYQRSTPTPATTPPEDY